MHSSDFDANASLHAQACATRNFNVALTTAQSMRTVPMPRYVRPVPTVHTEKPSLLKVALLSAFVIACGLGAGVLALVALDQIVTLILR